MSGRAGARHTRGSKRVDGPEAIRTPRARNLKRFGMDERRYDAMLKAQGGVCAICQKPPKAKRLSVDHDHTSTRKPSRLHGRIRGALCHRCNRYLVGLNTEETAHRVWFYLSSPIDWRLA